MKTKILLVGMAAIGLSVSAAMAQTAVVSTGGEATDGQFTLSYSLGQVAAATIRSESHSLVEGVQQTPRIEAQLIDAVDALPEVSLFPNPTVAAVSLQREGDMSEATVSLFTANGSQLSSQRWNGESLSLDLSDLPAGLYMVRIAYGGNRTKNYKIIKQ